MKYSTHKLILALTASILAAGGAKAYEVSLSTNLPSIDFHGFASQGFLASTKYNYLGDTTRGSFKFSEAGVNATMNPFPHTRFTAQGFAYDVGEVGKYDVVLDYALAEYTFNDYIGVRAGRISRPEGIYNDIQDVDLARTSVLLPQGMYNARWRDFWVTVDGGELFGTLPLAKAGTLSYELYDGLQRPSMDGGFVNQKAATSSAPISYINSPMLGGVQLWWNTPLEGFRVGTAVNYNHNMTFNTGLARLQGSPLTEHFSLEYLWHNWTFQAEYYNSVVNYNIAVHGNHVGTLDVNTDNWYLGAEYRFNKWFAAGTYYSEYYPNNHNRDGAGIAVPSDSNQKDAALSCRFDLTSWWIFKIEGHCIHGTGQVYDNKDNPVRDGRPWYLLALKTTVSF